jgi:integrase
MQDTGLLTVSQVSEIFQINETALDALVKSGQIPFVCLSSRGNEKMVCFNPDSLSVWLKGGLNLTQTKSNDVCFYRQKWGKSFPESLVHLKKFSNQFTEPKKPKGYTLSKVKNKKLGFVYYVRYIENGKMIPTRFSSHTNNRELADHFAVTNREKHISGYYERKKKNEVSGELLKIMKRYYENGSSFLQIDIKRGRLLAEGSRKVYQNIFKNHWIPYLKKQKTITFSEINTPFMARFQNYLLGKKLRPQTINHYISIIAQVFKHLHLEGRIVTNPCNGLSALKIKETEYKTRGCYAINSLRGAFTKRWKDDLSCLLSSLIYTTGMRNSEIERLQMKDIILMGKHRFICIQKSKTKYGVRMVPLHEFVYKKMAKYIRKAGKEKNDYVFSNKGRSMSGTGCYRRANIDLGVFAHYDTAKLKEENITFYSGRHFYKTMMNAYNLGEVEEYFMGHKVSSDVAKRYNHRDKQGQKKIFEKAREVCKILDKVLFTQRPDQYPRYSGYRYNRHTHPTSFPG